MLVPLVEMVFWVDAVVEVAMCAPTATLKAPKLSIVAVIIARFSRAASRSESAFERRAAGAGVCRGARGAAVAV